jgi:hypothetical protein
MERFFRTYQQMSFLTTNPNQYILNLPAMTNVVSSATGANSTAALTDSLNSLTDLLNTTNNTLSINTLKAYNGTSITFTNTVNLSNVPLTINGYNALTSNTISGRPYLAVQTSGVEQARFTSAGFGVGVAAPLTRLDVGGDTLIRGNLYVSTMGVPVTSTIGNIYVDGTVYAGNVVYPSDPVLKDNVRPYAPSRLPEPVEFEWKSSGLRDIGVLATDVATIEPTCVQRAKNGTMAVDYPKLVVLCLAECRALRTKVSELEDEVRKLASEKNEGSPNYRV